MLACLFLFSTVGSVSAADSKKKKDTTELTERKELVTMRINVLSKQEERLRSQVKDLQTKLQSDLRPYSPPS